MSRAFRPVALGSLVLLVSIARCANQPVEDMQPPAGQNGPVGSQEPTGIHIGPSGGTAIIDTSAGRVTIQFPPGAVGADTNLEISLVSAPSGAPASYALLGQVYDVTSTISSFQQPVTVTFPIPGGIQPSLNYTVFWFDGTNWNAIPTTVDSAAGTATIQINHFTPFGIFSRCALCQQHCPCITSNASVSYTREFALDNSAVEVYSIPVASGDARLGQVMTGIIAGQVVGITSHLLGAYVPAIIPCEPICLAIQIVSILHGFLQFEQEANDPVRVAPVIPDPELLSDGVGGAMPSCRDKLQAIIYLDFVGTCKSPTEIQSYSGDLTLRLLRKVLTVDNELAHSDGTPYSKVLMTAVELRSLDSCKTYVLVPKEPFYIGDIQDVLIPGGLNGDFYGKPEEVYIEARAKWGQANNLHEQESRITLEWGQNDGLGNQAPTANAQSLTTNVGLPITISLTGQDPDAQPQPLRFIIDSLPTHGSLRTCVRSHINPC